MNLLCKNILLNCLRHLYNYVALFHYICIQWLSSRANFHSCKVSIPFSIYFGRGFFYWFRVSESGSRYAHKTPFLAMFQNKNSISENFPQCEQCPKPDNSRPDKDINPGESLDRNNSLSLTVGLLYGAMLVCNCPKWFYRDTMAM